MSAHVARADEFPFRRRNGVDLGYRATPLRPCGNLNALDKPLTADQINRGGLRSLSKTIRQANILRFAVAKDDPEISDIDAVGACADTKFFEAPFACSNINLVSIETGTADAGRA
jgi:hypothetical protein